MKSKSTFPFQKGLMKLLFIMFYLIFILFISCNQNIKDKQKDEVINNSDSSQSNLSASELEDLAEMSMKIGDMSRAIDQLGRAKTLYSQMKGKVYEQARCLSNRARAYSEIDKHDEAFKDITDAKLLIELDGSKDRLYRNIIGINYREKKLLEMKKEFRAKNDLPTKKMNSSSIRPQVIILAKALLDDYHFRVSFLMDKTIYKSFPNQVKTLLELSDVELQALCLYGLKVHLKYHELIQKKYSGIAGFTYELSPGFNEIISDKQPEAEDLEKKLEREVGSTPNIDDL